MCLQAAPVTLVSLDTRDKWGQGGTRTPHCPASQPASPCRREGPGQHVHPTGSVTTRCTHNQTLSLNGQAIMHLNERIYKLPLFPRDLDICVATWYDEYMWRSTNVQTGWCPGGISPYSTTGGLVLSQTALLGQYNTCWCTSKITCWG